jgi:hypothetical protein
LVLSLTIKCKSTLAAEHRFTRFAAVSFFDRQFDFREGLAFAYAFVARCANPLVLLRGGTIDKSSAPFAGVVPSGAPIHISRTRVLGVIVS